MFLHKHCNITKFDTLMNLLSSSASGENTYTLFNFSEIIISGNYHCQWNGRASSNNQSIYLKNNKTHIKLKTWLEDESNRWAFHPGFFPENPGPATRSETPFLPQQIVQPSDVNMPSNYAITSIQHLFDQHVNERNQCMSYQESVLPELILVSPFFFFFI